MCRSSLTWADAPMRGTWAAWEGKTSEREWCVSDSTEQQADIVLQQANYCALGQVTQADLEAANKAVGDFGGDNRAGVEGTLHRISAIRNRDGKVVGLTCRVGRAVVGHLDMIRDLMHGAAAAAAGRLLHPMLQPVPGVCLPGAASCVSMLLPCMHLI